MRNKPFFIAAIITILMAAPLYFLTAENFQLSTANFPLLVFSLFVANLITAFWAARTGTSTIHNESNPYIDAENRELGNVKWFSANKGFGFITRDSGDDVFVHFRSIRGEGHRVLHDGQRVEFAISEGEKGLQADDVATAG
jgi:CspA family cold shock protein